MRALTIVPKPLPATTTLVFDISLAKEELSAAWDQYKQSTVRHFRDGLAFGRSCHQWQASYKAQGSHKGKGFEHLLERLKIPKTTAYRWIRRYEVRAGLRAVRNEVRQLKGDEQPSTGSDGAKQRVHLTLLLTEEQHRQFERDIKTLGGHGEIAALFLQFLSQTARHRRSPGLPVRNDNPHLSDDRLAAG